jgi:hypothetical protein
MVVAGTNYSSFNGIIEIEVLFNLFRQFESYSLLMNTDTKGIMVSYDK